MPNVQGEIVVDGAFTLMEIGVADTAGLHANQCLAWARIGHQDRGQLHRRALGLGDYSINLMGHFLSYRASCLGQEDIKLRE